MSILPFSVEPFGLSKPVVDEVKVPLRRGDTALRFFLDGFAAMRSTRARFSPRVVFRLPIS
jgi:hypothetical protein